jgi:hypothetical protein
MQVRIHRYDRPFLSTIFVVALVFAGLAAAAFAGIGILASGAIGKPSDNVAFVLGLTCMVAPIVAFVFYMRYANRIYRAGLDDLMTRIAGGKIGRSETDRKGGAVLAVHDGVLLHFDHGAMRSRITEIPLALVRSYQWDIPGYDRHLSPSLMAMAANAKGKSDAEASSGLFIEIADIDVPYLHVKSTNEKFLRKWCEILTQEIDAVQAASAGRQQRSIPRHEEVKAAAA